MVKRGTIIRWNDDKGYGFIRPADGTDDVFAHVSAFVNRKRRPAPDLQVRYLQERDDGGRLRAAHVHYHGDRMPSTAPSRFPVLVLLAFFTFLAYLVMRAEVPFAVAALYLLLSLITFLLYAADKSAARRGRWRRPEDILLLFGLLGGWPGGLLAQNRLRHKTRKIAFQLPFWITVLLNCGALWWLTTSEGKALSYQVLRQLPAWMQQNWLRELQLLLGVQ